jgi:hypothetical protein
LPSPFFVIPEGKSASALALSLVPTPRLYWHVTAVHTPARLPDADPTLRSTNCPAAIATDPVDVQLEFVATEQARAVLAIAPGVPERSVTVIVADCCEYTLNCVAVHPAGTHASTDADSFALALGEFTA